jgi:hypothetical protein
VVVALAAELEVENKEDEAKDRDQPVEEGAAVMANFVADVVDLGVEVEIVVALGAEVEVEAVVVEGAHNWVPMSSRIQV